MSSRFKKFTKGIAVFVVVAVGSTLLVASSAAPNEVRAASDKTEDILAPFASFPYEGVLPFEESHTLSKEILFDSSQITVTHMPISDEYIEKCIEESDFDVLSQGTFTSPFYARGANMPTQVYNIASQDYVGSGTFTNSYIWSSYYFMPNSKNQLHFEGMVRVRNVTSQDLTLQIVNVNDLSSTTCLIPAFYSGDTTWWFFDFYIGPLNPQHGYCIKFTPSDAINQHTVSFTVSHT